MSIHLIHKSRDEFTPKAKSGLSRIYVHGPIHPMRAEGDPPILVSVAILALLGVVVTLGIVAVG